VYLNVTRPHFVSMGVVPPRRRYPNLAGRAQNE